MTHLTRRRIGLRLGARTTTRVNDCGGAYRIALTLTLTRTLALLLGAPFRLDVAL